MRADKHGGRRSALHNGTSDDLGGRSCGMYAIGAGSLNSNTDRYLRQQQRYSGFERLEQSYWFIFQEGVAAVV